jgi:cobalt-zinc-cadmium efflux system outer membrane protein
MHKKQALVLFCCIAWLLLGCATRRYQPAPIVPAESASRFQARNLGDPGLRTFLEKNGHTSTSWPPRSWTLETLSLAALYFNPSFEAARARVAETQAAVVSAGARPNPSLSFAPGVPSPYLFSLDLTVPIETAGKRGHRVQVARSLDRAARLDVADSAWKIRSGVRSALLSYLLAFRDLEALHSEEQVRIAEVNILEERLAVGEIPRPEVDAARIELAKAQLGITAAEGQIAQAKTTLAASIGLPVSALQGFEFSWPDLDSPPSPESFSRQTIQRDAVLNRLDVRRSLAEYAATEADLRLELAKQYPDVQIGPGYTYEEKNNFFTIGLSVTLPLFNRNQGPIAEAEARRKKSGAAFLMTQAQVIAQGEHAAASYNAARKELAQADESLRKLQDSQLQMMQHAVNAGEEDLLSLNGLQLQATAVTRARLDALSRAQNALGALEDAVQRPLDPDDAFPLNLDSLNQIPAEANR